MSKAAVSIFAFGCYIFLNAITLVVAPNRTRDFVPFDEEVTA